MVITVMLFAIVATLASLAVYMRSAGKVIVDENAPVTLDENNEYDKIAEIDRLIQESYLNDYDRDNQMDQVYRTMLDSLGDKYSRYLDKEELEQLQQNIQGSFTGTGIVFIDNYNEEGFLITDVIAGGPAGIAGIEEGDIILKVDGKTHDNAEDLADALKGSPGTKVVVTVLREEAELEFSIIRGDVKSTSVDSKSLENGDVGYIKIHTFGEDTYNQFDAALASFENGKVKGVIIDLRNNPGGLFAEGLKVADRLLPECSLGYTVDKTGEKENYNSDGKKTGLNLVILINENTASTAEMVAAAIKENNGGKIVGVKSYGKGVIQETHMYDDGTAVNLTVEEFFSSDGEKIEGKGVTPDVNVKEGSGTGGSSNKDNQLEKAVEILTSK